VLENYAGLKHGEIKWKSNWHYGGKVGCNLSVHEVIKVKIISTNKFGLFAR
jgi:hypothetical protein